MAARKPRGLGPSRFRALEILTVSNLVPIYPGSPDYVSASGLKVADRTIIWLKKSGMVDYVNAQGAVHITSVGRAALVKAARAEESEKAAGRRLLFDRVKAQIDFKKREEDRIKKLNATWLRRMNKRLKRTPASKT